MEAQRRPFKGKYDLFTFCLVPGLTAALASAGSWFDTNLSVVGNSAGIRPVFAVWGAVTGWYYCRYTLYLFRLGRYRRPLGRWLVFTAAVFMMTAVAIPYEPELDQTGAALHVMFAFCSPVLLAAALGMFLRYLSAKDRLRFKTAWAAMWGMILGALLLLAAAGFISSFLEMFLVVGACGFLRYLERLIAV